MRLEIKDLHVHYEKIEAIKGISVVVNEGEIVTLIGANGAGKTTTRQCVDVDDGLDGHAGLYFARAVVVACGGLALDIRGLGCIDRLVDGVDCIAGSEVAFVRGGSKGG